MPRTQLPHLPRWSWAAPSFSHHKTLQMQSLTRSPTHRTARLLAGRNTSPSPGGFPEVCLASVAQPPFLLEGEQSISTRQTSPTGARPWQALGRQGCAR